MHLTLHVQFHLWRVVCIRFAFLSSTLFCVLLELSKVSDSGRLPSGIGPGRPVRCPFAAGRTQEFWRALGQTKTQTEQHVLFRMSSVCFAAFWCFSVLTY